MNPNLGIAQGILFNVIRLTTMVGVLVLWNTTIGTTEAWQRWGGIAVAFVVGHIFAVLVRRWQVRRTKTNLS